MEMRYFNEQDSYKYKRLNENISLEIFSINNKYTTASTTYDVFLSHSSDDKYHLPAIINFLEKFGANVYIDKADDELPVKTSSETGRKLKERIDECSKFIVLVSKNSKDSKWIPWELGVADEKKTLKNIALLPIVQTSLPVSWPTQEYFGLYPRIVFYNFNTNPSPEWMVFDHNNNSGTPLKEWFKK